MMSSARPGQVDADHREHERGLGGEVTGRRGIHRIVCGGGESELLGDGIRVEVQRRAGQRPGAVGRHGGALIEVDQAVDIAEQRMRMGQQMMGEQDRLGRLQMCLSGHDGRRMRGGLRGQCGHQLERAVGDPPDSVAQPEPKQGGHLVVSRSACPQPATKVVADAVDQPTFQRPVHVLVGDDRQETAVGHVLAEAVQPGQQAVALLLGQQPRPEQHAGMRLGCGDVVGREHPVEMGGLAQCGERVRRAVREPTAPQGHF